MVTEKTEKNRKNYSCDICGFHTSDKSAFTRHCSTAKHKEVTNVTKKEEHEKEHHICSQCGKIYESRMGLWRHSKKCTKISNESTNTTIAQDDILSNEPIKNYIMKLVEQNIQLSEQTNELKNMFIQQNNKHSEELINHNTELQEIKTILSEQPPQQITNIQNNKINNQFNLNVFLQQTCKDAINMSDFIDSLEINTKSLERTGTHGYVNGISKIFTDGIRKLKVHERPIHCTDLKREVIYIKDNDKWEKDTEDNKQFKKALATVVHRNMIQIVKWEEENPDTSNPESKIYEFYFEVVRQSLGGGDHDVTARNNEKILKAIAKEVHIDRKVKELL